MIQPDSRASSINVIAFLIIGSAACLPYLPSLRIPLLFDDLNTLYQAAITLKDPGHFVTPWGGGILRFIPKLWFMVGLELWGVEPWPYRLTNIVLHMVSALTLTALVWRSSGSRWMGFGTGLLFAVGFGAYGRAVLQISNITMVLSFCALLIGLLLLHRRSRAWGCLALVVSVLSHELAWFIVILIPILAYRFSRDGSSLNQEPISPRARHEGTRLLIGSAIILIVISGIFPGFVFEISREMIRLIGGSLLPINTLPTEYVASPALTLVNPILEWIVSHRWWIGILPLAGIAVALPRLNRLGLMSVVWILIAALPTAFVLATWQGEYIDRRYLYYPSVGLCVLGAQGLYALRRRRLLPAILLSAMCLWAVMWSGFGLWKMHRDGQGGFHQARYVEFCAEMGALDPKWDCRE